MKAQYILVIAILGIACLRMEARLDARVLDSWWVPQLGSQEKAHNFHGLKFSTRADGRPCALTQDQKYICPLGGLLNSCEMVFQYQKLVSSLSVPLLKLLRKNQWLKQFGSLNQYVEGHLTSGLGAHGFNQIIFYSLDNIHRPVLIRAFDVVMDEESSISISTKCDEGDWSRMEREVANILATFKN